MAEKKIPNPNGRKGSPEHQQKVNDVADDMRMRGLDIVKEYFVGLFNKKKKNRYVDVAGIDPATRELKELHQVGKQNKNGTPVKRERDAMDDIEERKGIRPVFHAFLICLILISTYFIIK